MDYIKSPLNYTGNKYRILSQIQPYFPTNIKVMVDLFCGGGTVGLNTKCEKIIFIDNNPQVIGLLKFLSKCDFNDILKKMELLIAEYHLSYSARNGYSFYKGIINDDNPNNGLKQYNKEGFYSLRDRYNSLENKDSSLAYLMLYVLLIYGFNNDLRFSRCGCYNLPVGKTDLNKNNITKLKEFIDRTSTIRSEFICGDFKSEQIKQIIKKAEFVYMDPPYLITDAVYNEMNKWDERCEHEVLKLMEYLLTHKTPFVLSNVLEKKGKCNNPLNCWIENHNTEIEVVDINYHYRGASYNKKDRNANEREIIVVPKKVFYD